MNKLSYPIFGARALSYYHHRQKTTDCFPCDKESINLFKVITTIILKRDKYSILSKIRQERKVKVFEKNVGKLKKR